mgnify:CR=1 FL=1
MKQSENNIVELSHIWLYVKDTSISVKFYRDIVGFEVAETFPDGALFQTGSILLGIHREKGDRKCQPGSTVLILRTINIDRTYKEFKSKGLIFSSEIKQEPYGKITSFKDPDGYSWELVEEPNSSDQ